MALLTSKESRESLDRLTSDRLTSYNLDYLATVHMDSVNSSCDSAPVLDSCSCHQDVNDDDERGNRHRASCACFRKHHKIVSSLEKDLSVAAEIGQALLHERQDMQQYIDTLKENVDQVNQQNMELIADNDELLRELNTLNEQYAISEDQIQLLSTSLDEAKTRIMWLNSQIMQSKALESQVQSLEIIRDSLQQDLDASNRDKIEAELRWRNSEKLLERLSLQYEQFEQETYDAAVMNSELENISSSGKNTMHAFVESLISENAKMSANIAQLEAKIAAMTANGRRRSTDTDITGAGAGKNIVDSPQGMHTPVKENGQADLDSSSHGLITPPKSDTKTRDTDQNISHLLHSESPYEGKSQDQNRNQKGNQGHSQSRHSRYPSFDLEPMSPASPAPQSNNKFLSEMLPAALKRSNSHDSIMSTKLPSMDFFAPPSALMPARLRVSESPSTKISMDNLSIVDAYAVKSTTATSGVRESTSFDDFRSRTLLTSMASATTSRTNLKGKPSVADSLAETINSRFSDRTSTVATSTSGSASKSWASAFFTRISRMTATNAIVSETVFDDEYDELDDTNIHVVPGIGFAV